MRALMFQLIACMYLADSNSMDSSLRWNDVQGKWSVYCLRLGELYHFKQHGFQPALE
jgi:hypothetical protein